MLSQRASWLGQRDLVMPSLIFERSAPPIGCNVKRESGAFSDEFSADLAARGEPPAWQRPLGPTALVLAQEAKDGHLLPARVFCLVPAHPTHPTESRPRGGQLEWLREAPPSRRPIARSSWP